MVKVGTTSLYPSEVAAAIPQGLSHEDSLAYASGYISRWARREAKLMKAESMFASSSEDIERMVEEYRSKLMLDKLDRSVAEMVVDTLISNSQIVEYYERNISDFRAEKALACYKLLSYDASYSNSANLLKLFSSSKSSDVEDLRSICEKNIFTLIESDGEWVTLDTIFEQLPPLDDEEQVDISQSDKVQKFSALGYNYYLRVSSYRGVGDSIPFELVQDRIRDILLKQQQQQSLREHDELIYHQALQRGDISFPATNHVQ